MLRRRLRKFVDECPTRAEFEKRVADEYGIRVEPAKPPPRPLTMLERMTRKVEGANNEKP